MLKRIFGALILTAVILLLGGIGYEYSMGGLPLVQPPLPPPAEGRSVRIVVSERPVSLPVRGLARLTELSHLKLDIRTVREPSEKWMLLSAGQVDVVVASLDEFALAVPRFDPGVMVFPVAQSEGSDAILKAKGAELSARLIYPEGTAAHFMALAHADPGGQRRQVGAASAEQAVKLFQQGDADAIAIWEPWVSRLLESGAEKVEQTSSASPITEIWVVSRQTLDGRASPRLEPADIQALAQAWFTLIHHLNEKPGLTLRAIAEENGMQPEQLELALKGLKFLTLAEAREADSAPEQLVSRLQNYLSVWSLAGAPNAAGTGDQLGAALDFGLLRSLSEPEGETASASPTAEATDSPTPEESPTAEATPEVSATPLETPEPVQASPMFRGNLERTGSYSTAGLKEFSSAGLTFKTKGEVRTCAAAAGELLILGSDDGNVYAVKTDGRKAWAFDTGEPVQSSPAVAEDMVYVGSNDGRLYALSLEKGEKLWTFQAGAEVASSPAVADGVVYFGSRDGHLYAVDAGSGEEKWKLKTGGAVDSSPAVYKGVVYVGSHDKKVYAVDAATGDSLWEYQTGNVVLASPCVAGGSVYIGSRDGRLYALNLEDGKPRWQFEAGGDVVSSAAYAEGLVCFGGKDTKIYAVDAETGKERWSFPTRERVTSSGAVADGILYIGGEDERIYALDLQTGDLKWRHKVEGWVYSPLPWNGKVYFGCSDKSFYGLE
ncbi:MAG: PQQ-binding-like beta-propeller repeat protein [Armatimonadetes bacterium]|nr:PQQ-binding-like beta-propeller repeat protein [Armatimonadota bacterium]